MTMQRKFLTMAAALALVAGLWIGRASAPATAAGAVAAPVDPNAINVCDVTTAFAQVQSLAVGSSSVQLSAASVSCYKGISIKAAFNNSGKVYVGSSNTVTAGTTPSTDGYELSPGDSVTLPLNNLNLVWLIGSASGQKVYYLGI